MRRALLAILALLLRASPGCASALSPSDLPSSLLSPALAVEVPRDDLPLSPPFESPAGVVFLVHGIWPDGRRSWVEGCERGLLSRGVAPLHVEYLCTLTGMVSGLGTGPPAERMAGAARALAAAHDRTRCRAALRFHAIGYSAGTIVTLEAAERGLRLETAHMAGSPINAFGSGLADAVREGRIRRVVNHASFVDGWVWALLGMGQLGYHGAPSGARLAIEDRWDITYHLAPPLDEARGAALADELLRDARARGDGPHRCFREASFRAAFERTRRALRDAEMPTAAPELRSSTPCRASP